MDRDRVKQLVALLKGSTSMELAVREGDSFIRIRRAPVTPPPIPRAPSGAAELEPAAGSPPLDVVVTARLVGRYYAGKGPGQPPLVHVGDRVEQGQTIATIEALGKLTAVPSPETGDVLEIIAEDGQAVGYGAPLLRIRKA